MPELDPSSEKRLQTTFGAELRKQREIRGISLREIADATKISHRFLEAIEHDDYKNLPAPVFTKGFIREYARYVGLSADALLDHYTSFVKEREVEEEQLAAPRLGVDPRPSLEIRIDRSGSTGPIVIGAIVVAAIAVAAFFYRPQLRELMRRGSEPEVVVATDVAVPVATPSTTPPVSTTSAAAVATSSKALQLVLIADDDSYVELDVDGESVLREVIERGDQRTFEAERAFLLRTIGNAGGLRATLNGRAMPRFGQEGRVVRNVTLDRSDLSQRAR
jgi:cytoskeleton protein RodZ